MQCETLQVCLCSTIKSKCSELEPSLHLVVLFCLSCACQVNYTPLIELDVKAELPYIMNAVSGLVA